VKPQLQVCERSFGKGAITATLRRRAHVCSVSEGGHPAGQVECPGSAINGYPRFHPVLLGAECADDLDFLISRILKQDNPSSHHLSPIDEAMTPRRHRPARRV
jgi:hypothetical protein